MHAGVWVGGWVCACVCVYAHNVSAHTSTLYVCFSFINVFHKHTYLGIRVPPEQTTDVTHINIKVHINTAERQR